MWQLDGNKARLDSAQLSLQVDIKSPATGLTNVKAAASADQAALFSNAALFQLRLPTKDIRLADAYVRGDDLVATYAETNEYPCRTQVYWRFDQASDYFGFQTIVSVQTSRLDAAPGLSITSELPVPANIVDDGVVLVPITGTDICYAEIVDASNVGSTSIREKQVAYNLFPGSLEKGVIRRARILGCFLAASSAEQTVRRIHERFSRSALPLTT